MITTKKWLKIRRQLCVTFVGKFYAIVKKTKAMRREYKALDNKIVIVNNSGTVKLYLEQSRPRVIGTIRNGVLITERKKSKHFHRMMQSYGFNYHLLLNCKEFGFDKVVVIEDGKRHKPIEVSELKQKGVVKYFKKQGFELQIFVNADIINKADD